MTPQPKIIITLKKNPLEKLLSEAESKGWTFTDTDNKIKLYVNYRVFTPPFFGIYEFDAARIEPATYVGHWGLCERIVF
jgi:hypothetical protein